MNRLTAAVLCAGLAFGAAAAQDRPGPAGEPEREELGPDPERETRHLENHLGLDPGRREKVRAVFELERKAFRQAAAVRRRFREESGALRRRIQELNARFDASTAADGEEDAGLRRSIRALLTPEQQKSFDLMQAERDRAEREWRERREQEELRRRGGERK